MQGALLILFPPTPASDWSCPSIEMVISRPAELINLGFSLKDNVIIDALHMFEHRLINEIGDILWDAFLAIRSSDNRQLNVITRGILIHPDLVNLWKQIESTSRFIPANPASDWSYPSIEMGDFLWDAFLAIRSGENVYMLAHLPSNARAAEITIITATNTKKQLIWLLKSRNLFLRSIFSSNRF
ncbi:hypothetical protein RhiirA5_504465 [Rhizophagus irregularis]|uniref:Uncharacterized protein n=1 Tax=Rhizophagus irregularis TaxID=588596 RepID=A0A2N0P4M0_9GLOM|nr:hypothetical protein RhiirA5_504465 [Rhizophagus irregularis]